MNWLSSNPLFDTFGQRALLRTYYGGADFGECLSTLSRIDNGTVNDWHSEWLSTANRIANIGDGCLAKGHIISAREAYLRASTYYHTAYFPLFGMPIDTRLISAFNQEVETFHKAAGLFSSAIEILEIPFDNYSLPAYFIKVDDSGKPRPTVIHTNGYDSNIQEMYFRHAPAAIRRGYNCLLFDGPGQGRNIIRDALPMRHDWEKVVSSIIDYAFLRPEIDQKKIILVGWSFGGFLAPRAAAFEHRIAALIADPGQWDIYRAFLKAFNLSFDGQTNLSNTDPEEFKHLEAKLCNKETNPLLYWRLVQRNFWVHGVNNLYDYFKEILKYEISSVASQISCPTLLTSSEDDPNAREAAKLYEAIKAPKKIINFTTEEGAGDHCETMARSLYHQRVFDWLDETL